VIRYDAVSAGRGQLGQRGEALRLEDPGKRRFRGAHRFGRWTLREALGQHELPRDQAVIVLGGLGLRRQLSKGRVDLDPLVHRHVAVPDPLRRLRPVLLPHPPPESVVAEGHDLAVRPHDFRQHAGAVPRVRPRAAVGRSFFTRLPSASYSDFVTPPGLVDSNSCRPVRISCPASPAS